MPTPTDYRIIYNWDGAPHGYSPTPQSVESFLDKVYAPLKDTQVDALFWSTGGQGSRWPSDLLDFIGEAEGRTYQSVGAYTASENIRQMYDQGLDPQAALIEAGHDLGLHVYASVRMNDNHFGGAQISDLAALHKAHRVETIRRDHPEWLLGNRTSEWFALSWNMAVPEIRQRRFQHVEEVCRRYDWDGIELDWQRHAFHFPEDDAYRLRYLLTDLQRAIRQMTQALGRKRGRPVYLAARVAGSLEMCRRIGYDIPTWIEEGLVDVLIPAGNAVTDASIDVADFVQLCEGTGVAVYPGFDSNLPDPFVGPEEAIEKDQLRTRAIASRYHRAGASGIYAFNWHADADSKRDLLTTIGSPQTLASTDKIYAATHRYVQREGAWRGAFRIDRIYGEVPVDLLPTLSGTGPTITLDVADDFGAHKPASLQLRLRLNESLPEDVVRVCWDGDLLGQGHRIACRLENPTPPGGAFQPQPRWREISDVSSAAWLTWDLTESGVTCGKHTVHVALQKRHPQITTALVLTDVELVVRY
ncbi:MAG: family 10 glycosylhydrolase [Gemmatimonadetes bacterium]|nr:family 10 glycosylhydrolase [Gemmatimonadota bacterium]MBT5056933.1 family 10 glycosylhydrolase [Gemmatimonadota bacterium]MBT5142186.1 family 10 glycosylhydrolase [Gemmatimonadota bacterium]MBT5589229.1 family 10 glycosylhydrolase [Gemmatimonadota bacterium]MBT5963121.1 family 10 glycosylhydrolase [Gemmatimonadota bacterium]